jgi:hypothetical protein
MVLTVTSPETQSEEKERGNYGIHYKTQRSRRRLRCKARQPGELHKKPGQGADFPDKGSGSAGPLSRKRNGAGILSRLFRARVGRNETQTEGEYRNEKIKYS